VVHSAAYLHRETVLEIDGDRWEGLFNGYTQSKWVAEKICKIACSRGIPVCIYRPGVISGHSQTGMGNTSDLLHTLLKGCIELGSAPDLDAIWDFTPVDYISQAIVHLSLQAANVGKTFHLTNPKPIPLSDLVEAMTALGYPVQTIAHETWTLNLRDFVKQKPSDIWESLLSVFPAELSEEHYQILKLKFDGENTLQGLKNTSITCPPVDHQLLSTYLSYLINYGFLKPPSTLATASEPDTRLSDTRPSL
ncbi:MAG: SDR family oxidoreductase, partial [Cyanobacteria bacterium P01_G01_bin.54]